MSIFKSLTGTIVYTDKNLKNFCWLWAGIFLLCAGISWWRAGIWWSYLAPLSLFFALLAFFCPGISKPFYTLWMMLATILSFITINVLLTVFFFLVITPISIILRLCGKSFFPLRPEKNRSSYWIKKDLKSYNPKHMEKQFS